MSIIIMKEEEDDDMMKQQLNATSVIRNENLVKRCLR